MQRMEEIKKIYKKYITIFYAMKNLIFMDLFYV